MSFLILTFHNFLSNSYRTTLCLEQSSSIIASSALFFAALQLGVQPVPNTKSSAVEHNWFELLEFDIDFDALQRKYYFLKNKK